MTYSSTQQMNIQMKVVNYLITMVDFPLLRRRLCGKLIWVKLSENYLKSISTQNLIVVQISNTLFPHLLHLNEPNKREATNAMEKSTHGNSDYRVYKQLFGA